MNTESTTRIFLGAPVAIDFYQHLKSITSTQSLPNGQWIPPENAHITIRFFGEIHHDDVPALLNMIQETIRSKSFYARVEKIGYFPQKKSHLIAAHLEKSDALNKLFSLANTIPANTSAKTERDFLPHITLYRAKGKDAFAFSDIPITECELKIESLALYESKIANGHRHYSILRNYPFL